ncbi:hypothetical protein N1027_03625 [Herbiconiux sp. CPCC 205763]|uniref:Uncharacterized protein n=1 Tax=Herbiconiux aconitum TaxID=2970913 RepID=A0ABT2GLX0_9MICO|nr:hypothetical protein [Herbiconiux aconitum]MCS5717222.1 hypothetical protein [Herbiconiux aconitum]
MARPREDWIVIAVNGGQAADSSALFAAPSMPSRHLVGRMPRTNWIGISSP